MPIKEKKGRYIIQHTECMCVCGEREHAHMKKRVIYDGSFLGVTS